MRRPWLLAAALAAAAAVAPAQPPKADAPPKNRNARWGLPGPAKADPQSKDSYLIDRPQYVLSYSDKKKTANWVAWNLVKADVGRVARGAFEEDPGLPAGFARVQFNTYTGSGFDRGHLCPSRDRSAAEADNDATFYMTNIVPQSPACNQKGWERLESYCRDLAADGKDLYVVAGPWGIGGQTEAGQKALTIGRRAPFVSVPAAVWKVVLVLPNRAAAPNKTTARLIAAWMPNDTTVTDDWPKYRVPAAEVEKKTGLTFFPLVPDDVATALKERADDVKVVVPPRAK
ncbi:MAG: DNA/RNA non-specific endonuclease [Gemmataceae bacterium]|nr:DNA/RNA non-specific endonuclease [Gemmataceae bacterium]